MSCCSPTNCVNKVTFVDAVNGSNRCGQIGSRVHPYRSLDAANRATPTGWTLNLAAGSYRGRLSLTDKSVYAEMNSVIHIDSSDLFEGLVDLQGYAELIIDRPAQPGQQNGIYLTQGNQRGSTTISAKVLLDRTSTEAGLTLALPPMHRVEITFWDVARSESLNAYGLIHVVSPPDQLSVDTKISLAVAEQTQGLPVLTSDGNCIFAADQLLTTGTAVLMHRGINNIQVTRIGQPDPGMKRGIVVDGLCQATVTVNTIHARYPIVFSGSGELVATVDQMGTALDPCHTGVTLGSETSRDLARAAVTARSIWALNRGVDIYTPQHGSEYTVTIGRIGDGKLPPKEAISLYNGTFPDFTSKVHVDAQIVYAWRHSLRLLDAYGPPMPPRGPLHITANLEQLEMVERLPPPGAQDDKKAAAAVLAAAPSATTNLTVNYMLSKVAEMPGFRLQAGTISYYGKQVEVAQHMISLEGPTDAQLAVDRISAAMDLVNLDAWHLPGLATLALNATTAIAGQSAVRAARPEGVPLLGMADLKLLLGTLNTGGDTLLLRDVDTLRLGVAGTKLVSGGKFVDNNTLSKVIFNWDEATANTPDPAILLGGGFGAFASIQGTYKNLGPVLRLVNPVDQTVNLVAATFSSATTYAVDWPYGPVPPLTLLGNFSTSPVSFSGPTPTIIPAGAPYFAGPIRV